MLLRLGWHFFVLFTRVRNKIYDAYYLYVIDAESVSAK